MIIVATEKEVPYIPNWSEQLAELVRHMWMGADGKCYFPYPPLTTPDGWLEFAKKWASGEAYSRFALDPNNPKRIVATASIINEGEYWEIGRFNSYEGNERGTMSTLVRELYALTYKDCSWVVCETTQCHTSSQYIASEVLQMRFAGYGFFRWVDGVPWDILYFDNCPRMDFISRKPGQVNDLLGIPGMATPEEAERLLQVPQIVSTEKTSGFPPRKFHIYDRYIHNLEDILRMNVPGFTKF